MSGIDPRPGRGESLGATVATNAVATFARYDAAALVVTNQETGGHRVHALQRGPTWDQAVDLTSGGKRGKDARQAIRELADKLGLELRARSTSLRRPSQNTVCA